jgi:hypothetical protein
VVAKHELQVALYSRSLSRLMAVAADGFEMPVSCAGHLTDFCGVCLKLAFFIWYFVSKHTAFCSVFLVQK